MLKRSLQDKQYSGTITVADVEEAGTKEKPLVRMIARVTEDYSYSGMMQFEIVDLSKATQLSGSPDVD